uniref:Calcitonin n=1 Tax=Otolemur garnettii TaxID=30611 RepID=H0WZS9_OTOGA
MGFRKFSPFLALSILVLCQAGSLQAAPFRSNLESSPDLATLSEEEARLLLAALVQDYVQMKASELEQELETEGSSLDSPRSKCYSDLSTYVLGMYSQCLNNFYIFPGINFGPGIERDIASSFQRACYPHFGVLQDAN